MEQDHVAKTIAVYNTIADEYAKNIEHYLSEKERDDFLSLVPPGGSILDLGCAAGRDSRYFSSKGFKVIGVDLSEKLLAIAKKKSPEIDFRKEDIRALDFPENSFDATYASAVLLHLKRRELVPVLKNLHAFLKSDGLLYVQVKEGTGDADVAEKLSSGHARHFTYYSLEDLKTAMLDAGFFVEKIYSFNELDLSPDGRDLVWISCFARK